MQELTHRDALTNLYTQTAAQKIIVQNITNNPQTTGLMIMFDLDNFKRLNEQNGHLFGDQILKHIARLSENNIRKMDICSRIGGDRFLMYFSELFSEDFIQPYCASLTKALTQKYKDSEYTVSMGAAMYPQDGTTYEELFLHTSQALETSKRRGKNCFTRYHDSLSTQDPSPEAVPE